MSANSVRAGGAHVEIGVKDKLAAGLNGAAKRLRSFAGMAAGMGAAVVGAGTAILAPLIGATAKFLENGDALSKLSDRTGVSVESLSELSYAATQSGASMDDLQNGFSGMAKMMLKGDEESKKTVATLERMGVSMASLDKMSPEQRFTRLADAIANVQDPTEQAALAARMFGGAGQQLLPMLRSGADGMDALRQRAKDLGLVMSGEDAAAATTLGDLWGDLLKVAGRLGDIVGGALAPVLIPLADWFVNVAASVGKWVDANRPLIVTIAKMAAVVVGIGGVLTGIAAAAMGLSFVFSGLAAAVSFAGTLFAGIGTVLAAIVSPVMLAVAAIVAAGVAFFTFTESGQAMWATIQTTLFQAYAWVKEVFGGIYNAIASGNLGLAAEIAWTAVKVAFFNGVAAVQGIFAGMLITISSLANWFGETFGAIADFVSETFAGISNALSTGDWAGAATIAWQSIKLAFLTGVAEVSRIWHEFTTGLMIGLDSAATSLRKTFGDATGWIAKQLVKLWGFFDKELKVDAVLETLEEDTQRKRDALTKDLDNRNSERATALSQQLADTEAKLQELRTARSASLEEAATAAKDKPSLLHANTDKLASLLDQANQLANTAMDSATKPPPEKPQPGPDELATAAGVDESTSGLVGTFSGRNLGSMFGPDRVDIQQLQAAQKAIEQRESMLRLLSNMARHRAVYGA